MQKIIKMYRPANRPAVNPEMLLTKEDLKAVGLEKIAGFINKMSNNRFAELEEVKAPKKQLYVMIIGNHSAGKSTFVNWYVGDQIQNTNVAIETVDFSFIMHGAQKQNIAGENLRD